MNSGFNHLGGGSYPFINQAAVTNAMASGQNIDWASLAQAWIQMRDNAATTTSSKDTNRPPDLLSDKKFDQTYSGLSVTKYEEKGEADMDMDDEELMDDKDNNMDKNGRGPKTGIMQPQSTTSAGNIQPHWFVDKKINAAASNKGTDFGPNPQRSNQWSPWSNNQNVPHTSCQPNTINRQMNPTAHIPSLLKMNVPHPNEIRALQDNATNEESNSSNIMDAAKRKGLPAWIREGLEKMEREKQKQQEKHIPRSDPSDTFDGDAAPMSSRKALLPNTTILKQVEDEDSTEIELPVRVTSERYIDEHVINEVISSDEEIEMTEKNGKSYEQKLAELMIVVRHTLTELLLEVTNEEISKIANETVKSYKLKASSAQVIHKSALSSITGKLGLAAYGDSSSSDEYSDDDGDGGDRKTAVHSESGNDSEEEIKNTVRLKRRSFLKIANEIEERVSAAAAREEEKLKYFLRKEEATESGTKKSKRSEDKGFGSDKREMVTNESISAQQLSTGCSDKIIGKIYERESGETTETKLQLLNGKRQRNRGSLKERTTRFSDNKDNRYLAIAANAAAASCITDTTAKGNVTNSATMTQTALTQSHSLLSRNNYTDMAASATLKTKTTSTAETELEIVSKRKHVSSPENDVDKDYKYAKRKRHQEDGGGNRERGRDRDRKAKSPARSSSSRSKSSSSSKTSTSSSSSSTSDSSTTTASSDNSKYSHRSDRSKRSTQISKSTSRSQRDKYDDDDNDKRKRHYSSRDKKYRDSSSYSRYRRDRSRSRHRRHGSEDSDDAYSRRKHDSRYSSSHSRSHNSSKSHRHFSRSESRSSYSSSSKRRQ